MHLLNELIELPDSHHDNPLTKVCHPHDQRWSVIGLPAASDFTYLRKNEALLQHCGQWQQKVLTVKVLTPSFCFRLLDKQKL